MRFEKKKIREWHQIANSNGRKEREKRRESVVCLVVYWLLFVCFVLSFAEPLCCIQYAFLCFFDLASFFFFVQQF